MLGLKDFWNNGEMQMLCGREIKHPDGFLSVMF